MAKQEWIGNYFFTYKVYYSYKDEWVAYTTNLGHCLSVDEAVSKAVTFLTDSSEETIIPIYISDGWGNKFIA